MVTIFQSFNKLSRICHGDNNMSFETKRLIKENQREKKHTLIVLLYFQIKSKVFLLQLGSQFTDHIAVFYTHLVQLLILRTELGCGLSEIICEQLDLF